jgi:cytochrome c biogenesis protein CcmG, thiol:disulfide interchange protein DsbE
MRARPRLGTIAVFAAVVVLSALIWANRGRFTPLDVGSRAPDYAALSLDGDTVQLASFLGEVVLLNIWATWCLPCVREMPALQRLHEELGEQGLRIVAVSVDAPRGALGVFGQPGGDVAEFRERFGITFTVLHDPSGRIQSEFQVNGLPTTFVIDRDGRIQRKVLGAAEWDQPAFADGIRSILGAE